MSYSRGVQCPHCKVSIMYNDLVEQAGIYEGGFSSPFTAKCTWIDCRREFEVDVDFEPQFYVRKPR